MPSTFVVTGAAGRIGGSIGSKLKQIGHRVIGVDIVSMPPNLLSRVCDSYVQCALVAACEPGKARDALVFAMAGATGVVHCAAWPVPSASPPPAVVAIGSAAKPVIGL